MHPAGVTGFGYTPPVTRQPTLDVDHLSQLDLALPPWRDRAAQYLELSFWHTSYTQKKKKKFKEIIKAVENYSSFIPWSAPLHMHTRFAFSQCPGLPSACAACLSDTSRVSQQSGREGWALHTFFSLFFGKRSLLL